MELRMSREKLDTGHCLKSHSWITEEKIKTTLERKIGTSDMELRMSREKWETQATV
jgi:hypothetical protein